MTIQNLDVLVLEFQNYKKEHLKKGRTFEAGACDLYLAVFKKCNGYIKTGKHETYIKNRFYDADYRRLCYSADDLDDDAFLQASIQQALIRVWQACSLPDKVLVKRKYLPISQAANILPLIKDVYR